MSIGYLRFNVFDIGPETTTNDLSDLFGFKSTEELKNNTCVQIKQLENGENYAFMLVPATEESSIMKYNEIAFDGRVLRIQKIDESNEPRTHTQNPLSSQQQGNDPQVATPTQTEPKSDDILHLLIDCRSHPELNFPAVNDSEICAAIQKEHSDDPFKTIKRLREIGTYSLESNNMGRYVGKSISVRDKLIELIPVRKRERKPYHHNHDPDGIKIRIFGAFGHPYRNLAMSCLMTTTQNWG